jgi:hypothetical protein
MYVIGCKYNMDHGCVKQTDETQVLRISYVQEPEQENLSILYYPCDLDEDHTKEKIIQKLVDHI